MKLDWALLSNAAEGRAGLVYLLGGGWDTTWRDTFPAPFIGAVAFRVLASPSEAELDHTARLRVLDTDGAPIAPEVRFPVNLSKPSVAYVEGWDISGLVTVNLTGLIVHMPGMYRIEVAVDDKVLTELRFRFLEGPAPDLP
ncbi:MAG TPA: hypothetical protein VNU19_00500 [Candidatus Acidoferrum sp.]|jgi:hypothetical protein|nr:hypothetical protein [Candidatus Acidoferrum sp.]